MFTLDASDRQRIAVSSIGALILSAAALVATGPARAETPNAPLTVGDWQQVVEQRIDDAMAVPAGLGRGVAITTVTVRFNGQGDYAGAAIRRSSGNRSVDRAALRIADGIDYPALPHGLRGKPQTVAMQLYFARTGSQAETARQTAKAQMAAVIAKGDTVEPSTSEIAALPIG